ncbi:MAG: HAD family phosphatase [Clostridiales bacterium]|nr:HAD family phosphatase [Clostridiales bacterium]
MSKLILTDLDHTLLRSDGNISDHTLEVLKRYREEGMVFAIATARYWIGAERYIDLLKPDYEITTDGTLIHSKGQCIYSCEFTIEDSNRIVRTLLDLMPEAEITVACGKTVYWNSKFISSSEKLHKAVYFEYDKDLDLKANKIVAELPDETIAREIADLIGCRLQCYRGEKWYSFLPKDSGKTCAIKAMSELSGIGLKDMVAFGDDLNDIDMLKLCGKGIAVSNAIKEVLDIADDVTLSNDEDGVASWIERNI